MLPDDEDPLLPEEDDPLLPVDDEPVPPDDDEPMWPDDDDPVPPLVDDDPLPLRLVVEPPLPVRPLVEPTLPVAPLPVAEWAAGDDFGLGLGLALSPGTDAGAPSDVIAICCDPLTAVPGANWPMGAGGVECFLVMAPTAKVTANTTTTPAAMIASVRGPKRRCAPPCACVAPTGATPSPAAVAPCTSCLPFRSAFHHTRRDSRDWRAGTAVSQPVRCESGFTWPRSTR